MFTPAIRSWPRILNWKIKVVELDEWASSVKCSSWYHHAQRQSFSNSHIYFVTLSEPPASGPNPQLIKLMTFINP